MAKKAKKKLATARAARAKTPAKRRAPAKRKARAK